MASVRMTNELRSDIRRKAEKAYELSNPEPSPSNAYIELVRNAIINDPGQTFMRSMLNQGNLLGLDSRYGYQILPSKPKDIVTAVNLRITTLAGAMSGSRSNRHDYKETAIRFASPLVDFLLLNKDQLHWGVPSIYINDFRDEDKSEIIEQFENHRTAEEAHTTLQNQYNRSISNLVEQCTTLKQLLEIWPAAESLVPANKIQRLHTKVTRIERAKQIKEEISFDPTFANQTVLTAKLLGG